jgi:hypothetical protein
VKQIATLLVLFTGGGLTSHHPGVRASWSFAAFADGKQEAIAVSKDEGWRG